MRTSLRAVAVVLILGSTMLFGSVGTASASTGSDYGQHVRHCAQTMGFDGTHNPGRMHRGFSGWVPGHVC